MPFSLAKEKRLKRGFGIAKLTFLEFEGIVPPPSRRELRKEAKQIGRERGLKKAIDVQAFKFQKNMLWLRKAERKRRLPRLSIGGLDIGKKEGTLITFSRKKRGFVRLRITPKGIRERLLFK